MLTGLSVDVGEDGRTIRCCCKGEERAHEFAVDLSPEDGDDGDLGYQPASGEGSCKDLPDYLQDGIICAHSHGPHAIECACTRYFSRPRRHPSPGTVEKSQAPTLVCKIIGVVMSRS
jgi:hypothetical protein